MKKQYLLISACLLTFNAYSAAYTGLNLGINSVNISKELVYPLEDATPTSSSFQNAYTNFHAQLLLGYDFSLSKQFSTSLEGDADLFTGQSRYIINNWYFTQGVSTKEHLKYGFSFFLIPTYHYNEFVNLFIGPGISLSNFSVTEGYTAGNVGVSMDIDQWLTGVGLKLGTSTKINNNLQLLLTYQFTQYNSVTRIQTEPLTEETVQGRYKPNVNTVLIGLKVTIPE